MDQTTLPQQEITTAKFEEINRQHVRVGTLQEFVKEVFKKPLDQMDKLASGKLAGVWLAREKFIIHGDKVYRLIWVARDKAWLCGENTKAYQRVYSDDGIVEAGKKLAGELNVRFSEIAR